MENWKQERKARRKKQVRRQKQILAALLLMIVFIVSVALKPETKEIVNNTEMCIRDRIDSVIDRDIAQGIVATDNYLAGRELGEFTRGMVTDQSQIGIVAHVKGSSTAIERENGMREGLGEYENQIMDVVFCGSSYDRAYKLTADMLEKYPKMEVIMGTNEYSAVGAARAVKDCLLYTSRCV